MKPIRRPENVRIQVGGAFPVNVCLGDSAGLEEGQGRLAKKPDHLADFEADDTGGVLGSLLAEEDELDRRALWRLGSWGVGATGAVILAVMANQSSLGLKREQVAAADLTRQAQQIQWLPRKPRTRRGGSPPPSIRSTAIATGCIPASPAWNRGSTPSPGPSPARAPASASPPVANPEPPAAAQIRSPRRPSRRWQPPRPRRPLPTNPLPPPRSPPRLRFTPPPRMPRRPTQSKRRAPGWKRQRRRSSGKADLAKADLVKSDLVKSDSAKSDLAKVEAAKPSPATPLMAAPSMMAPPDPAASKLVEPGKAPSPVIAGPIPDVVASASPDADADEATAPKVSLQRTEFGVDLGTANSVNGLRMLWRGLLKSRSNAPLAALRPIIVIKEGTNGLGMQLRLVAGPLNDAGAAARICAVLTENKRPCETAIFDGQRLSLKPDDPPPAAAKPTHRRRGIAKRAAVVVEEAEEAGTPPATTQAQCRPSSAEEIHNNLLATERYAEFLTRLRSYRRRRLSRQPFPTILPR